MQKSQISKVKTYVPAGSCLLLFLLAFLVINPVAGSVYAEEKLTGADDEADYDVMAAAEDGISAQATDASTVGISFSPISGSASLSPTTSAGQSAQIKVLATVNVQNSGGYSVYVKSNSQNLVGAKSSANTIPGLQGSATYANLPVNTWGYAAAEGTTIANNATYKAISTTGNGDKITENTNQKITSDTKTIALSFAARINDTKPADTYRNTVTMSVVSSPMQVGLMSISDMQEMTPEICADTPTEPAVGSSKQLRDTRDGKYYWVTKLKDGNCWMTQNLALDIPETGFPDESVAADNMTWQNSDMSEPWTDASTYPPKATVVALDLMVDMTYESTLSLNQNDYLLSTPLAGINCSNNAGQGLESEGCERAGFVKINNNLAGGGAYDEHYLLGNYYQWNAATAGTGGTIVSVNNSPLTVADMVDASASICPRNWRLPVTGGVSQDYAFARDGSFGELLSAYGWTGPQTLETNTLASAPIYFIRAGWLHNGTILDVGQDANVWSSTAAPVATGAYHLGFGTGKVISPSFYSENRGVALPVRCVAR